MPQAVGLIERFRRNLSQQVLHVRVRAEMAGQGEGIPWRESPNAAAPFHHEQIHFLLFHTDARIPLAVGKYAVLARIIVNLGKRGDVRRRIRSQ